jgi:hypothetical protein
MTQGAILMISSEPLIEALCMVDVSAIQGPNRIVFLYCVHTDYATSSLVTDITKHLGDNTTYQI